MSGLLEYIKLIVQLPRTQPTLPVEKVPLMFEEPYILTGYRPINKPWLYYIRSFFQLHNESVNVWTHALAFFLVLLQVGSVYTTIDFATNKGAATIIGYTIGCLLNASLSTLCHLLHSKSPWWHYVWFLLDYAGVTFVSFGTGLGCIYACSHKDVYVLIESFFLPLNVALCWMGFLSCCIAKLCFKDPYCKTRKFLMVFGVGTQAFLVGLPVMYRYVACYLDDACSMSSLTHLHFVFILLFLDALTFSTHMPEELKPGYFDIVGHGHQIFHVVVLATHVMQMEAIRIDVTSGASAHTNPDLTSILTAFGVLMAMDVVSLICMRGLIRKKVEEVLKASKCD